MIKENLQFKFLSQDNKQIPPLLSLAVGNPTPEKIKKVLASYLPKEQYLFGAMKEGELIGLAGIEKKEVEIVIRHIAIKESHRCQGVGKALIEAIIKEFSPPKIIVETDQEAVGFYRKCGFICCSLQGKYPGRQLCERYLDRER